ncbi:LysR substrate-binding domain-containing protein [Sulfitobacter sp. PR48]|uniref:hydrogen peroxide-inducible genes activator n=1 Tax=Sulfitobacter sp. PR48 TaxID=3028383 RepID=UPI00237A6762|nr:hydrogen peroxide-inducible genes activator [Sulfitobacter sp. PR48]MDD9722408.1 LysR substrate-binding domain-containing protein [Sulfitobacter sp. PR48]
MKNLTIRQFRYFEAIAEQRHFGRAAQVCAISQPALSTQIKEMETTLGKPLFERGPRQVRPTAFGVEFAGHVRAVLEQVEALENFAREAQGDLAGQFRLGVIPTIAPYLLPRLIGPLTAAYPGIDLHVRETLTSRLVQELQDGRLDAAIVALPVSVPSLTEVPVFSERFVFVRPEAAAGQPAPGGRDLADMRVLLLEEGHCFRDQALAFCNRPASVPRTGLDGSSLATLVQMVGAGIGVTVIPQMAVRVETRSAAVDWVPFAGPQPKRTVGMIWRKASPLTRHQAAFAQLVRQAAGDAADIRPEERPQG